MMNTAAAPEFAEGTLDFASESWFCVEHTQTVKVGEPCAFCKFDELGPQGFERWAAERK